MENITKKTQESLSESVIFKLNKLSSDPLIGGHEFGALRDAIGSIFTLFNNEFVPNQDNSKLLAIVSKKLMFLTNDERLSEQKFQTFRTIIGSIENIVNNDLK